MCWVLRVMPPGIEWKTGRKPKVGKNSRKIENGLRPERKMAPKWRKISRMTPNPIFPPCLGHFFPISGRGPFSIFWLFFPFSAFGPFSILCQAAWLASRVPKGVFKFLYLSLPPSMPLLQCPALPWPWRSLRDARHSWLVAPASLCQQLWLLLLNHACSRLL